jgi:hypothetical protein
MDYFISHAAEDEAVARKIAEDLEADGRTVFLAVDELGRTLKNPADDLTPILDKCARVFIVWSDSARAVAWIALEWAAFFKARGVEACEVTALDTTPFPSYLDAKVRAPRRAWIELSLKEREAVPAARPRLAKNNDGALLITASPSSIQTAALIAERAERPVHRLWDMNEAQVDELCEHTAGSWILVAAKGEERPKHWAKSLGGNPDEQPRRLVVAPEDVRLPSLLALVPRLGGVTSPADEDALDRWLAPPRLGLFAMLRLRAADWTRFAASLHDGLSAGFSSIDPRLEYVDARARSEIAKVRLRALAVLVVAHALAFTATYFLPLVAHAATRRHLVLSVVMIGFAGLSVELKSLGAGLALLTRAGIMSAAAVLIAGFWQRQGTPGIAFGAGAAFAAAVLVEPLLNRNSRLQASRPLAGAVRGAVLVVALFVPIGVGALLLHAYRPLVERTVAQQTLIGLIFGVLGGLTVGAIFTAIKRETLRRRDRRRAFRILAASSVICGVATAIATGIDPGDSEKVLNGVGVGLFCGALIVGLSLGPAYAMSHRLGPTKAAIVSFVIALVVINAILPLFPNVQPRYFVAPALTLGAILFAAMLDKTAIRSTRAPERR